MDATTLCYCRMIWTHKEEPLASPIIQRTMSSHDEVMTVSYVIDEHGHL